MITVGVPLGGVCEGVWGDSCDDDEADEEEWCGDGDWPGPPGRMLPIGPPITSGLTPLIRAFDTHTIRWAAAAATAAAPGCISCGKPAAAAAAAATCCCTSFLTRNKIAASLLGCLRDRDAGCINA